MEQRSSTDLRQGLTELALLVGAFMVYLWILKGLSNRLFELPALFVIAAVFVRSIKRRGGFERVLPHASGSSLRAWLEILAVTAVSAIGLLVWGMAVRGPYDEIPLRIAQASTVGLVMWAGQHLGWATLQQVLLQLFLRPVIGEILQKPPAVFAATALLFGLLHLPCSILVASATVLGALWIALFSRYHRIAPLIVSHATISALAVVVLPPHWNCDLKVGIAAQRTEVQYGVLRSPDTRKLLETVTSDEYLQSSGGTDRDFIKSLYRDMLGRAPADSEVQHWLGRLNEGLSKNRIAVAFAGSEEYRVVASNRKDPAKGPQ